MHHTYDYTRTWLLILTHLGVVPNEDLFEFEVSLTSTVGVVAHGAVRFGPVHIRVPFTFDIKFINLYLFAYFQNNSPLKSVSVGERVAMVNRVVFY